ncbi:MAG: hypothetical protein AMJ73_04040 [candidate division Zixibacteria bacterium SM1_73]|nr:MAG: hypothetical protein AMJ73_04040 [candidate division Zixibacteria bacterium SM1_73]
MFCIAAARFIRKILNWALLGSISSRCRQDAVRCANRVTTSEEFWEDFFKKLLKTHKIRLQREIFHKK